MSESYENAITEHNAAFAVFDFVRQDFRKGLVSDAEFLSAKSVYSEATLKFDAAFAEEAGYV